MVNLRKVVDLGYLFANGGTLSCRCNGCGHADTLAARPLLRRFGAGCPATRLERLLTCSRCGRKGAAARAIWPPDPRPGAAEADSRTER